MKLTIRKGHHYSWPPRIGLWLGRSRLAYRICFNESSGYRFDNEDQKDYNKLFGIGWWPGKNSFRIGWRYLGNGSIELAAYRYINGVRVIDPLVVVKWFTYFDIVLHIRDNKVTVQYRPSGTNLWREHEFPVVTRLIGFPYSFYFGGNQKAPQTITIEMSRI